MPGMTFFAKLVESCLVFRRDRTMFNHRSKGIIAPLSGSPKKRRSQGVSGLESVLSDETRGPILRNIVREKRVVEKKHGETKTQGQGKIGQVIKTRSPSWDQMSASLNTMVPAPRFRRVSCVSRRLVLFQKKNKTLHV